MANAPNYHEPGTKGGVKTDQSPAAGAPGKPRGCACCRRSRMAAAPRCDDAPPATADGKAGRGGKVDPPASESSAILQGTPRSDGAPAVADSPDAARWRHLLLFALLECSNSLMWITFSPIGDIVSSTFNVGSAAVNLLSTIYSASNARAHGQQTEPR